MLLKLLIPVIGLSHITPTLRSLHWLQTTERIYATWYIWR